MPYEHDNELVDAIHQTCGGYPLPEILAALVTVTVENAHASAVEEQFHGLETNPPGGWEEARSRDALFDELLNKIMYRLFVGDDNRTPPSNGGGLPITRSARLRRVA